MVSVRIKHSPCVFGSSVLRRANVRQMKHIQLDWNHFLFYENAWAPPTTKTKSSTSAQHGEHTASNVDPNTVRGEPLGISLLSYAHHFNSQYCQPDVRAQCDRLTQIFEFLILHPQRVKILDSVATCCIRAAVVASCKDSFLVFAQLWSSASREMDRDESNKSNENQTNENNIFEDRSK